MEDTEKVYKFIEGNNDFDYCRYCMYENDCPKAWVCYGGEPIEPYCVAHDIKKYIDIESILEDIENGDL